MKKKLEAELISIAHRILKLKNKSDIIALHTETQKLYEKLSVLRFVEESFGDQKPTIGTADLEAKLEDYFDKEQEPVVAASSHAEPETEAAPVEVPATEPEVEEHEETPEIPETPTEDEPAPEEQPEPVEEPATEAQNTDIPEDVPPTAEQPETTEELQIAEAIEQIDDKLTEPSSEAANEKTEDKKPSFGNDNLFAPAFELAFDPKTDDAVTVAKEEPKFSFDDLLGKDYADPVFITPEEAQPQKKFGDYTFKDAETIKSESKAVSLNDRLSKGITIGLNDRIAFIKHLFADSSEDYNRVLSQLMTFDTFDEAQTFINDMVKPDYNDWTGKDEYAERFMDIVEKRFS